MKYGGLEEFNQYFLWKSRNLLSMWEFLKSNTIFLYTIEISLRTLVQKMDINVIPTIQQMRILWLEYNPFLHIRIYQEWFSSWRPSRFTVTRNILKSDEAPP
jgi:hypothetical protein